jgi:hypothetical protein
MFVLRLRVDLLHTSASNKHSQLSGLPHGVATQDNFILNRRENLRSLTTPILRKPSLVSSFAKNDIQFYLSEFYPTFLKKEREA